MRWPPVFLAYVLCTSCVMSAEDPFVASSGLGEIQSREQLFERDLRLTLAGTAAPYDSLDANIRSCLKASTIERADPELLAAADGFLARKSEATWQAYRQAQDSAGDFLSGNRIAAMSQRCQARAYRTALLSNDHQ